jgi:hypothetical protein
MLPLAPRLTATANLAARGVATVGLLAAPGPVLAQEDFERIVTTLRACAPIEDIAARVMCYDNNIYPRAAEAALPSRPSAPVAPAPTAGAAPSGPAGFGREMVRQPPQAERPAAEDRLRAEIAEIQRLEPGIWLLTLSDGAQWRFVDAAPLSYAAPRVGETVELERGSLGSVFLAYGGQKRLRVVRVR